MIDFPFPHEAPEGYSYEVREFKRNVLSIWLRHSYPYSYTSDTVYTIWGFYNSKKRCYYSPINATKQGNQVDIENTTPYTAMPINLNPLEHVLYSTS